MFSPRNTPRANTSSFSRVKTPLVGGHGRNTPKGLTPQRRTAGTPSFRGTPTIGNWSFNEETSTQRLELFGSALPVLVTEALTQCNKSSELSVQLTPRGWALLVWGNKLLLWRYNTGANTKAYSCKELTLPPSDSPYTADLVTLVTPNSDGAGGAGDRGESTVGCVAVSPQGTVRYWNHVAHEGSYVDVSCAAIIQGGQDANTKAKKHVVATAVVTAQMSHCIIGTSIGSLILVTLPAGRQREVKCRLLQPPHGMLSGIGRKMSSLIWGGGGGAAAAQQQDMQFYRVVCGELMAEGGESQQAYYMLAGPSLHKWTVNPHTQAEKMLYQFNVEKIFAENIARTVWGQSSEELGTALQIWLLDIQPTNDGVLLVGAAINSDVSNNLHFGIGSLHTEGITPPQSFMSFTVPKFTDTFTGEDPTYRLVVPEPFAPSTAYLYDAHIIICVSVTSSSQPVDKVEFHSAGDRLLGGGIGNSQALFFSLAHGMVTMKGTGLGISSALTPQQTLHESMMQVDPSGVVSRMDTTMMGAIDTSRVHEMSTSDNHSHKLKAAFLQSCRKNMNEADTLVTEILAEAEAGDGCDLDKLVIELSKEMIDDCPASDPRWAESVPHSGGMGSGSLILQHQLEDKLKAHHVLINFLKQFNIWQQLSLVKVGEKSSMETRLMLCEHAEKIAAAIALRELHVDNARMQKLVDKSINMVMEERDVVLSALTPHDVFYREVSSVSDVFVNVVEYEDIMLQGNIKPDQLVTLVSDCNTLLLGCVGAAVQHRTSNSELYESEREDEENEEKPEYTPWTTSIGDRGMRTLLLRQYDLTLKEAIQEAKTDHDQGVLFDQLTELADRVLEGLSVQLTSQPAAGSSSSSRHREMLKTYEQTRNTLIMPLVEQHKFDHAASLAEKYCDFGVLVQLCETSNDEKRLLKYMNQFLARGFAEYVFRWYVGEGLRGKLLASAALSSHPHLARFLADGDNKDMSWLHHVNSKDYSQASTVLQDLGMEETQYLAKKKTLLSLAKLCAMAADDNDMEIGETADTQINTQLEIITHQELLPDSVLQALDYELDLMPVLTPKELIQQHVGASNRNANEYDFKKALDMLQYLDKNDSDGEDMLLHIWCQALLRDEWTHITPDHTVENSKDTVFFKTVELAYTDGLNLREYLPPVDKLLGCESLAALQSNTNFNYLVRAVYEQIQRILN